MPRLLRGRYSDHGLEEDTVIEFADGGNDDFHHLYPPGLRTVLHVSRTSEGTMDRRGLNGHDAVYYVVSCGDIPIDERNLSKFTKWLRGVQE